MFTPTVSAPIQSGSYVSYRVVNNFPSGSAMLILSGNMSGRRGATIYNHSAASLYLAPWQSVTGSATNFMVKLPSASYYELPAPVYLDRIWGAWDGAGGSAMVVDFQGDEE